MHGFLDYIMAVLLVSLPFAMGFDPRAAESAILFVYGALMLFMGILTRYELGIVRVLPVRLHLTIDILAGGFLAILPVMLDIEGKPRLLFILLGLFEVVASYITETDTRAR